MQGVSSEFKIAIIARLYSDDEDYAILENNILTVLQNDIIVQIDLESRALIRRVTINSLGCNFGIYYVNHRYIVYGEIDITCFDSDFNTMWSFSGYDIFLSPTNKKCFEIVGETIKLYDFYDNYYEIDLNGVARHP